LEDVGWKSVHPSNIIQTALMPAMGVVVSESVIVGRKMRLSARVGLSQTKKGMVGRYTETEGPRGMVLWESCLFG